MSKSWTLVLAALVGAAIAVPAVVIARGTINAAGNADAFTSDSFGPVETQGNDWTPIGGNIAQTADPIAMTVSATMTKGKAKFRLTSTSGDASPESALFSAGASNSFTFGASDSCPPLHLEWKRKGDTKAEADLVSVLSVYESAGCF